MIMRGKFSAGLLCMGLIVALLPISAGRSLSVRPQKLMVELLDEKTYFSVDQIAKFLVTEDSTVQFFDLRSPGEFSAINIPGSINIPYNELLNNDPGKFLSDENIKKIFYSNGDFDSNYAFAIASGLNYKNIFVMKGGMNEWFKTIMNSNFSGDKISARENALFETRFRARKMFSEINSLPDSLKVKYIEAKHIAAKKLDGGCE